MLEPEQESKDRQGAAFVIVKQTPCIPVFACIRMMLHFVSCHTGESLTACDLFQVPTQPFQKRRVDV